jgi:hypothetical protein
MGNATNIYIALLEILNKIKLNSLLFNFYFKIIAYNLCLLACSQNTQCCRSRTILMRARRRGEDKLWGSDSYTCIEQNLKKKIDTFWCGSGSGSSNENDTAPCGSSPPLQGFILKHSKQTKASRVTVPLQTHKNAQLIVCLFFVAIKAHRPSKKVPPPPKLVSRIFEIVKKHRYMYAKTQR